MKYIFCGNMYLDVEKDLREMKVPLPVSSHKFQVNMLKGLIENGQDIEVINIPRIRYFPHFKKFFVRSCPFPVEGIVYGESIGFVNLPVLNYITQYLAFRKALVMRLSAHKNESVILIAFNTHLPQNKAMLDVEKMYKNVYSCGIIGDLHGKYGLDLANLGQGFIKGKIVCWLGVKQDRLISQFDAFGFLTKYMAEALGVEEKPHTTIEGIYIDEKERPVVSESEDKLIFYAGEVSLQYGIQHLLDAFELIDGSDYRLTIAGKGDGEDMIKKYAAKDPRITYLGFITPSEVERQQQMATVLINPRTSDQKFVKYSFPSKNMECLASGKPYIAHKLICNPPEYDDHIQYPEDESDAALAAKIVEICEMSKEQRDAIGRRAREFILREKNPKKQMEKIVRMMDALEMQTSRTTEL